MRGPEVTNVSLRHINSTDVSFLVNQNTSSPLQQWSGVLYCCKTFLCFCKTKDVSDGVFEAFLLLHISQYCSWISYSDLPNWRHNIWFCGCFGCYKKWQPQSVNHCFWLNLSFKFFFPDATPTLTECSKQFPISVCTVQTSQSMFFTCTLPSPWVVMNRSDEITEFIRETPDRQGPANCWEKLWHFKSPLKSQTVSFLALGCCVNM